MRGTFGETLERLVLLQVGAAAATRKRVEQVVEDLIAEGRGPNGPRVGRW